MVIDMDQKIKAAKILLQIKAVTSSPKRPYRFTSGMLSPVYTDCRLLMAYPRERKQIVSYLDTAIKKSNINPDLIAGTATAAIPHASWVAEKLNLPMVYVRGKAKGHGKGNQVEGVIKKPQKAVVVEDLITTGGSAIASVQALRKEKKQCSTIFAIMTYGMKKASENLSKNKISLVPITDFIMILETAEKMKYISAKEKGIISEWVKSPNSWGKKMGFE